MKKTSRRISTKSEATRAKLLEAAKKEIGLYGYAGATVDAIASQAGVSKGVVYYYFKTKSDIATSVLTSTFAELVDSFEQDILQSANPHDALESLVRDFAHRIFSNREGARFILAELWRNDRMWSEDMRALEERLASIIEQLLCRAIEAGFVRPDIDRRFCAIAVVGTVLTSAQYYLLLENAGEEESFEQHCIDFIQHALQA